MSRITKEIAAAVAKELCVPKSEELRELTTKRTELMRAFYSETIPDDILIEYNQRPDWFNTTYSIRVIGEGLPDSYKYYPIGEELPCCNKTDRLKLTPKQAAAVVKLDDLIDNKDKEIKDLKRSIENALYNLRTYNNVAKEFPEAFEKLPPPNISTALIVNLKDIRCKLDKANC